MFATNRSVTLALVFAIASIGCRAHDEPATFIRLSISRSREYLADAEGARLSGDPAALADALTRLEYGVARFAHHAEPATASLFIVSPFAGGSVPLAGLFSTHPSTEERVRRLRAMVGLSTTRLVRNALVIQPTR